MQVLLARNVFHTLPSAKIGSPLSPACFGSLSCARRRCLGWNPPGATWQALVPYTMPCSMPCSQMGKGGFTDRET